MSEAIFSPQWYRVKHLKPQLPSHVEMHRHDYRGLIWYILDNKATGRSHRFNSTAYQVIGLMNGDHTVDQIWNLVNDRLGDFAPTQEQMIQLLARLHEADLLQSGLPADTEEVIQRGSQQKSNKLKQRFVNPLSIKIPLWDPDDFLLRHLGKVTWLFHWAVALTWCLFVCLMALTVAINWQPINAYATSNMLSPYNLAIVTVLYPLIKLVHELGHAFSARFYGGEVHELGVSFLFFMPIPYVDVSSINFLRSGKQRIIVSAAGIFLELLVAALGVLLWVNSESGLIKDIAFNMLLIGGVSSLIFNANPLLKYDGYYMLADALEIPNLYQRSFNYIVYLGQKYLCGLNTLTSPASAQGEAGWFALYGFCSMTYRLGLLWYIVSYLVDKFFVAGVVLAAWVIVWQIVWPLLKAVSFVINSPLLQRQRSRAIASLSGVLLFILSLLFWLPVPAYTRSEGVIWMPEDSQLRAETAGFAGQLQAEPATDVKQGTVIVEINDPLLDSEVEVLYAKLKELNSQYRAEMDTDRIKADNIKEEMLVVAEELKQAKKNQEAKQIVSKNRGRLVIPDAKDLPGKFIHQGEIIGYVIGDSPPIVRVLVSQADIGQIQTYVKDVDIRLVNHLDQVLPASIIRRAPNATNTLPSPALATIHGGKIAVNPEIKDGPLQAQEKVFQIDLRFKPTLETMKIGQRVFVRFDHGTEPLAIQWYRSLRQVFLRRFNV